jgi:formylglycine-generating enzyme required for sulfatase activity
MLQTIFKLLQASALLLTLLLAACADPDVAKSELGDGARKMLQPEIEFDSISDCNGCPELVAIQPGVYRLGEPPDPYIDSTKFAFQDRLPVQNFEQTEPYAIGRYEVTVGQYRDCIVAGGCSFISPELDGYSDSTPVIFVHWHDAQEYVAWLAEKTGKPYRLPTEIEWEIAARGGTETLYWWGDELNIDYANVGISGEGRAGTDPTLQPVGSYPPNPFGLYDVIGNVIEWTSDCATDADEHDSDGECFTRIVRSSVYRQKIRRFHPAYRRGAGRTDYVNTEGTAFYTRNRSIGFRVARDLP